jgi:hypothetical protein
LQQRTHRGITLVTVFRAPQIAPISRRVGEKGDEIADAHHVDAAREAIAVVHHRRQAHVATV